MEISRTSREIRKQKKGLSLGTLLYQRRQGKLGAFFAFPCFKKRIAKISLLDFQPKKVFSKSILAKERNRKAYERKKKDFDDFKVPTNFLFRQGTTAGREREKKGIEEEAEAAPPPNFPALKD